MRCGRRDSRPHRRRRRGLRSRASSGHGRVPRAEESHLTERVNGEAARLFEPTLVTGALERLEEGVSVSGCPVADTRALIARAAISVPGVPHMTSSASFDTFPRTRSRRASASSAPGASRHVTRRIPVSPQRSDDMRGSGSSIFMKSGRARKSSRLRRASSPRSSRVSACPSRRSSSSAQSTPAAPAKRLFKGLVARQRSQSSARQRSLGPRSASSVSETISRIASSIRRLSHASSVTARTPQADRARSGLRRRRGRAGRLRERGASSDPDARSGGCVHASR